MSGTIESILNKYNYYIHELADPRTQVWLGVSSPFFCISILFAYLYFCLSLGPRLMKDRKPFELTNVLLIYNTFQVLLSLFLVYTGSLHIFHKDYNLACEEIDFSDSPRALAVAAVSWWYYFAKITELLDTVLFVLRKKMNQVSFLHVYHHSIMLFFTWIFLKYIPGGQVYLMGYLNSIVHVIMYSYYLIAGLGPKYQKYIWWKKYVTLIQLVQFFLVFVHNASIFFYECNTPKITSALSCVNALTFIYMFGKFYIRNYKTENAKQCKQEAKESVFTRNITNNVLRNGKDKAR